MARKTCSACFRPEKTCICDFITPIENQIELGILQHPDEEQNSKGTAIIARLSLQNLSCWAGENFSNDSDFCSWLQEDKVYLLYPPTQDNNPEYSNVTLEQLGTLHRELQSKNKRLKVLMIDATWRKSYKIMQLNPKLQKLDRVALQPSQHSEYRIRKQKDELSLSSVEAIHDLLSNLEGSKQKYQPLLLAFAKMQALQMSFYEQ